MIEDYPLFGIGTGGWQANYMLYQAEYFLQATNSPYTLLADNIFYTYNEFLYIMIVFATDYYSIFCK